MGGLTFLNGAFAAGFAAVAIPVVIHLMNRRFPREVPFPTVEFLRFSVARKTRIHNLRHLILLLLRMLLVAALVTAFCLPLLKHAPAGAVARDAPAAVILIIDVSASVGYPGRQGTALDRARREALDLLGTLRLVDTANVIRLGADSGPVFPEPASNFRALASALEDLAPLPQSAQAGPAFGMALEQIRKSGAPRGEIVVFSDFQATNWSEADLPPLPGHVALTWVDAGEAVRPNLALTGLRTIPAQPVAGSPFEVLCEVAAWTDGGADVPVRLFVDGRESGVQPIRLGAWSSGVVSFPVTVETARWADIEARLPADEFALDNIRYAAVEVRPRIRVAVISDQNPSDPDAGLYYLLRALEPAGPGSGRMDVTVAAPGDAAAALAAGPDAAILAKAGPGGDTLGAALVNYVNGGGGLLWFAGTGYNKTLEASVLNAAGPSGFFPFIPGAWRVVPESQDGFHLDRINTDRPPFSIFRSPENGDAAQAVFRGCHATREVVVRGQVLARFDHGPIALARTVQEKGVLLFANFAIDPALTDWVRRPTFVPFLHECLVSLREGDSARPHFPGIPAEFTIAGNPAALSLRGPGEERIECLVTPGELRTRVFCTDLTATGIHRILSDGRPVGAMAVNLDPVESDMRTAPVAEIAWRASPAGESAVVAADRAGSRLSDRRQGRPVWMHFLIAALFLALVEQSLTALWRVT